MGSIAWMMDRSGSCQEALSQRLHQGLHQGPHQDHRQVPLQVQMNLPKLARSVSCSIVQTFTRPLVPHVGLVYRTTSRRVLQVACPLPSQKLLLGFVTGPITLQLFERAATSLWFLEASNCVSVFLFFS